MGLKQKRMTVKIGSAREAAPKRDRATLIAAWIAAGAALVAAFTGVAGVLIGNSLSHDQATATHRAETYGAYLGALAAFNETAWSISAWAGTGAPSAAPISGGADSDSFWAAARQEQASLESYYLTAMMATDDPKIATLLTEMRSGQQSMWLALKCTAKLQVSDCTDANTAKNHTEIVEKITAWSGRLDRSKTQLVETVHR
ncbi:hypothetical protein [Microbacterium capsulatum]|uniref:Uncharacterized protein n=1 Tax=Microbacterium capsulatum TaxID=3041921 RepID=A0ABU0XG23_9MICO|nr:hypothetical protein [Microbacterium sp. ASV81]MDQ4214063.1 hypothetical protein [Microbacterium sp. ASV81]